MKSDIPRPDPINITQKGGKTGKIERGQVSTFDIR